MGEFPSVGTRVRTASGRWSGSKGRVTVFFPHKIVETRFVVNG